MTRYSLKELIYCHETYDRSRDSVVKNERLLPTKSKGRFQHSDGFLLTATNSPAASLGSRSAFSEAPLSELPVFQYAVYSLLGGRQV